MRSFFLLLSLLLITFHGAMGRNLIYETCSAASRESRNVDYTFCKKALLAAPAADQKSVQKLGQFSITLIQKSMQANIKSLDTAMKKKGVTKVVQGSLTSCSQLYTQTLDDLSDALDNYKSKNFYEVNEDIIAADTAATSCEDGFADRGVDSPLKGQNDQMGQLAAIALHLVNLYARVQ